MAKGEPLLPPIYRWAVIMENGHGLSIITDREIDLTMECEWLMACLDDGQQSWADGRFRKVWIRTKKIFAVTQERNIFEKQNI